MPIYGKKAETILSQAYTNIVLRTREPRAAKHFSELIGKAQLERARESKPARWFRGNQGSYSSERVVDPVVMESEIQGLEDLHGYFVQQDKVVAIRFRPQAEANNRAGPDRTPDSSGPASAARPGTEACAGDGSDQPGCTALSRTRLIHIGLLCSISPNH